MKGLFTKLKHLGFFGSAFGIAVNTAAAKSRVEVGVGACVGSICGTGINFSAESLECAADIAEERDLIHRRIAVLTKLKEDISGVDLTTDEDRIT